MSIAGKVVDLLGRIAGGGHEAPGDLDMDEPVLRVWVESADDVPSGTTGHRCPGGIHYYDVPVSDLASTPSPDSYRYIECFDSREPATAHPAGGMAAKEWIPYEGPQGGSGWENTISGAIRYVQDKPAPEPVDPDSITEEDLADIDIQTTTAWREADPETVEEGHTIGFADDNGNEFRGMVTGVGDGTITVDTQRRGEMTIDAGAELYRPEPVFLGSGPAGADTPWIPRDGEPSRVQLAAEAARSSAATEGYGNTESMESFVALAAARGADEEDIRKSLEYANELRPTTTMEELDGAFESGMEMAEQEDADTIERIHYERAAAGDPPGASGGGNGAAEADRIMDYIESGSDAELDNPIHDGGLEPLDKEPPGDWPMHPDTNPDTSAWVPVEELVSEQDAIDVPAVKHYMDNLRSGDTTTPAAGSVGDGEVKLQDGNHKAVAAWLLGFDRVPVDVYMSAGERYEAAPEGQTFLYEKLWVPYEGPQGGTGWQNTETEQVVYADEPPGKRLDPNEIGEPTHPVKSFGELEEGKAIELTNHLGTSRGIITSVSEEPRTTGGYDREITVLTEASGEQTLTMGDLRNMASVKTSPPKTETTDAPLGVDYAATEVKGGTYRSGGYEILDTNQRRKIEDRLTEKHGEEAVENINELTRRWKGSSYSDSARARERAFAEALGLDGPLRNDGLNDENVMQVTPEMKDAAADLTSASREFMRRHHADEDGNIEVHRGLSQRVGNNLQEQIFERYAQGGDADEPAVMNMNAMDNYSVSESTARGWANYSALITEKRPVDDVVVATDFIQTNGGEGEVSMAGGDREIDLSSIQVQGEWGADKLFSGDLDDQDRVNVMKTMRHLMDTYKRRIEAENNEYYDDHPERDLPGNPPNPAVLNAAERFISETRENASSDSEAVERARTELESGFEEVAEGGDYIAEAMEEVVRKMAGMEEWMALQKDVPFGSNDPEEWADAMATGLPNAMDKGAADKVMEIFTGEPGLTVGVGDTYVQDFADETETDLKNLRGTMNRYDETDTAANRLADTVESGDSEGWEVRNAMQKALDRDRWLQLSSAAAEATNEEGDDFTSELIERLNPDEAIKVEAALGGESVKAGTATGSDIEVDFTGDPDNIDWIARSRDDEDGDEPRLSVEKSWVPYEGPQGGKGWQNLETGEVTYQDDPPGDTLSPEELVAAAEEAGMNADEVRDAIDELRDAEPAGDPSADAGDVESIFAREPTDADIKVAAIFAGSHDNAVKNWYADATGNSPGDMPDDPLAVAIEVMDATDGGWRGQSRTPDSVDMKKMERRAERAKTVEARIAEAESDGAKRALRALGESDASDLSGDQYSKLVDRVEHDGANAVSADLAERVMGSVEKFKATGTGDDKNRAYYSGRQDYKTDPDGWKSGIMALGEKGSDKDTITHEFGHGLAAAYAYDHPGERSTAHDWRGDRGADVRANGWDFGGKHDAKKDYLLTSYGAWEDRGTHEWDEFESRGEPVVNKSDVSVGDRVAFRNEDGDVVEGTVMPATENTKDLVGGFSVGDFVWFDDGSYVGVGKVTEEGNDTFPEPYIEPATEAEKREIGWEDEVSIQYGKRADPDHLELLSEGPAANDGVYIKDPNTGDITRVSLGDDKPAPTASLTEGIKYDSLILEGDGERLMVEDIDPDVFSELQAMGIENADVEFVDGIAGRAITFTPEGGRAPDSVMLELDDDEGEEVRALFGAPGDEVMKMRGREERDWVPVRDFNDSLRGEAVRFKFGAQDRSREGVVTDETGGQVLVEFIDGNGNPNSRWVNKNQSFQQSVWVAEDRKEFKDPSPSENPPGWHRARYETMEFTERDVDWDTHVQYEDEEEWAGKLATGDMMLLGVEGNRAPTKVTDYRVVDTFGGGQAIELDVNYPPNVAEKLRKNGVGEPYLHATGEYGQIRMNKEDVKLWGHAEREQLVPGEYDDEELDDFVGTVDDLGNGDIIRFTRNGEYGPFGTGREKTAMVKGFGTFTGGGDYITLDDGYDETKLALDSLDVEAIRPASASAEGAAVADNWSDPPGNMLEFYYSDIEGDYTRSDNEFTVQIHNSETGDTMQGQMKARERRAPEGTGYESSFIIDVNTEDGDTLHTTYGVVNREAGLMERIDETTLVDGETYTSDKFTVEAVKTGESLSGAEPYDRDDTGGLEPGMLVEYEKVGGAPFVDSGKAADATGEVDKVIDEDTVLLKDGTKLYADHTKGVPYVRRAGEEAATDQPTETEPPDPEEAVENLFEEVNVAWWKMASKRNKGRRPSSPGSDYAESNTQETLAMTHQSMQSDHTSEALNIAQNHPDLMMAYLDVFEPSGTVKEALNDWHDETWSSPFEDTPFPEVVPEEYDWGKASEWMSENGIPEDQIATSSLSGIRSMADSAGFEVPGPGEIDWEGVTFTNRKTDETMTVRSVVEGDLLVEGEDGDEFWASPNEAYRYTELREVMPTAGTEPPNEGSTGRVPEEYGGRMGVVVDSTSQSVTVKPTGSDDTVVVPMDEWAEANQ